MGRRSVSNGPIIQPGASVGNSWRRASESVVLLVAASGASEEVGDPGVEFSQVGGDRPQWADLTLQSAQPVQKTRGTDVEGGA